MLVAEFISLSIAVFGWTDLGGMGGGAVDEDMAGCDFAGATQHSVDEVFNESAGVTPSLKADNWSGLGSSFSSFSISGFFFSSFCSIPIANLFVTGGLK